MNLDDPTRFGELDPDGMLKCVSQLPQQCRAAWALTQELDLSPAYARAGAVGGDAGTAPARGRGGRDTARPG
jgi:hypothetical protein